MRLVVFYVGLVNVLPSLVSVIVDAYDDVA